MLPMLAAATSARPQARSTQSQSQTISTQSQRTLSLPLITRGQIPDGTLRLRGGPIHSRRVTWSEEVIDNEGLGRKKSKVCCIYKRNREFGESSDESSSDDGSSSSDDSDIDERKRKGRVQDGKKECDKGHDHNHNNSHDNHEHGRPKREHRRRAPSPNAYEKMPRNSKSKEGGSGSSGPKATNQP